MKNNLIYSVIFISLFVFIGSFFIYSQITNSAQLIGIRQGGTATGTAAANNIFFGSSGGLFFTQDNNFTYATTTDTLTLTNASTTNLTISGWLNSSTDRLPNGYFTNLDSTNATIGTLTLTSQMASGDLLVNGQGKFGTTATTTISGNNGTSAFSGNLTVNSTTATSTFSTGGLTVGTNQFVVQQNSGNVGIGTTTPGAKLDIVDSTTDGKLLFQAGGHANIQSLSIGEHGNPNDGYARLMAWRDSAAFVLSNNYNPATSVANGDASETGTEDYTGRAGLQFLGLSAATLAGSYYDFAVAPAGAGTQTAASVMRILGSGNVGIGTTSPAEQLSISNRLFVGGTGTSTIENNLYVMGTLRSTVSYVGDLIFSNLFKFTEDIKNGLNRLVLKNQKGQEIWSIDELGKMQVKKICIEEICIDKNQLRKLLNEK